MEAIRNELPALEIDKPAKEEAQRQFRYQLDLLRAGHSPRGIAKNVRLIPTLIEAIDAAPVDPLIWSALFTYARAIDDGFLCAEGLIVPRLGLQAPLNRIEFG